MENRLKHRLAADELTFCLGVNQARTPNVAMIAAAAGFDAIYVDLEHNPTSLETCSMLCIAALGAGITPMVRIGSQDGHLAAGNDVQYLLRGATADVERMRTIPVPR